MELLSSSFLPVCVIMYTLHLEGHETQEMAQVRKGTHNPTTRKRKSLKKKNPQGTKTKASPCTPTQMAAMVRAPHPCQGPRGHLLRTLCGIKSGISWEVSDAVRKVKKKRESSKSVSRASLHSQQVGE